MNRRPKIIAEFIDEYEEKRIVHRNNRGRLAMKTTKEAVGHALSHEVSRIAGQRIRQERRRQGLSMRQLAERAGLTPTKMRMKEIEDCTRYGVRLGTIYALAHVLGLSIVDLLPTVSEAVAGANITRQTDQRLAIAV